MARAVHELVVFMASPGDLVEERDAIRELDRTLNSIFENRGVRVRVVGWEHVAPEAGRAQGLINPLVDDCDVFIGLLNRRWGSATGEYSSGFEEEFERALQRRTAHGSQPVIGMYFAEVPAEVRADPGVQLQAVLAFQRRIREEHIALYKTFSNAEGLAGEILAFLVPHLLDLIDQARAGLSTTDAAGADDKTSLGLTVSGSDAVNSEGLVASRVHEAPQDGLDEAHVPDEAQLQISAVLGDTSDYFVASEQAGRTAPDWDRIGLLAAAFSADDHILGNHLVNRLFKRRNELQLTLGEGNVWARTYLSNYGSASRGHRTVPVWGALSGGNVDETYGNVMMRLAVDDDDTDVVRGLLRLLTEHRTEPSLLWPKPETSGQTAKDETIADDNGDAEAVRERWRTLFAAIPGAGATLNYVATVLTPDKHAFIASLVGDEKLDELSREALQALVDVIAGKTASLPLITPSRYAADAAALTDLVVSGVATLDPGDLESMLTGTPVPVAAAAAAQLAAQTALSESLLKKALAMNDPRVDAAVTGYAAAHPEAGAELITVLEDIDRFGSRSIKAGVLAAICTPEDLAKLRSDELHSVHAWEAMTIQDPHNHIDDARAVLDGTAEFLTSLTAPFEEDYRALARAIDNAARRAACKTLRLVGGPNAADLDRFVAELRRDQFETSSAALLALLEAVTAMAAAGSPFDLGNWSVPDDVWTIEHAAKILESPLAPNAAQSWVDSDISELQRLAQEWWIHQTERTDPELEENLYSDSIALRLAALNALFQRWSRNELEALLTRYDSQKRPYWYNVIAALDAALYGPTTENAARQAIG